VTRLLRSGVILGLMLGAADCVVAESTNAAVSDNTPQAPKVTKAPAAERPREARTPAAAPASASAESAASKAGQSGSAAKPKDAKLAGRPSTERQAKSAEKLGLDLTSDAPLKIDSAQIDIVDSEDGGERIRFSGGVVLKQGDLELTCAALDAYYPKGAQGRPQRIVADGDVLVVQGEMELRCTRAEFDDSKCSTICLSSVACGSPEWPEQPARLIRGDSSIEGRQLEFDLCTSRLSGSCGARVVLNPDSEPRSSEPRTGATAQPKPAASAAVTEPAAQGEQGRATEASTPSRPDPGAGPEAIAR